MLWFLATAAIIWLTGALSGWPVWRVPAAVAGLWFIELARRIPLPHQGQNFPPWQAVAWDGVRGWLVVGGAVLLAVVYGLVVFWLRGRAFENPEALARAPGHLTAPAEEELSVPEIEK